ncbi:MAG: hypothetical protein ACOVLC_09320 [Flavobacterium sp.]
MASKNPHFHFLLLARFFEHQIFARCIREGFERVQKTTVIGCHFLWLNLRKHDDKIFSCIADPSISEVIVFEYSEMQLLTLSVAKDVEGFPPTLKAVLLLGR